MILNNNKKLIEVSHLTTAFHQTQYVVEDISFVLERNTITALIGESGSGKSHLAYALLQLMDEGEEILEGDILWKGNSFINMKEKELQNILRNDIGMVFQEVRGSFDPIMSIKRQMMELLDGSAAEKQKHIIAALKEVGLNHDPYLLKSRVSSLSTGMCQRIAIAMALLRHPDLLILDEPCASLDAIHRASLQDTLLDIQRKEQCSMLYITHDIASLYQFAQRIIVMYCHEILELRDVNSLFHHQGLVHPYTAGLLHSIIPQKKGVPLPIIKGSIHDSEKITSGCRFAPRCPYVEEDCILQSPKLKLVGDHHEISCFHPVHL